MPKVQGSGATFLLAILIPFRRLSLKVVILTLKEPKRPSFGPGPPENRPEICVGWLSSNDRKSETFRVKKKVYPKMSQI